MKKAIRCEHYDTSIGGCICVGAWIDHGFRTSFVPSWDDKNRIEVAKIAPSGCTRVYLLSVSSQPRGIAWKCRHFQHDHLKNSEEAEKAAKLGIGGPINNKE